MSTIHLLAADLANRCPALAQDSPTNRATVIEGLITEAMQGAVSQELFDAMEANLEKFEHENVKLRAELATANQRAEHLQTVNSEQAFRIDNITARSRAVYNELTKAVGLDPLSDDNPSLITVVSQLRAQLAAANQRAEGAAEQLEQRFAGVLLIRCSRHINVPQKNANELSGGECGACIDEQYHKAAHSPSLHEMLHALGPLFEKFKQEATQLRADKEKAEACCAEMRSVLERIARSHNYPDALSHHPDDDAGEIKWGIIVAAFRALEL